MDDELEQRVSRLEGMAAISGPEGVRLADSVDRLGLNANALGEALLQVDRNQQSLTKLGKQLSDVEATVVPRAEVEDRVDHLRQERRRALHHLVIALIFFVPFSAYMAIWMHELYRDACVPAISGIPAPDWCAAVFPGDNDGNEPAETTGHESHR